MTRKSATGNTTARKRSHAQGASNGGRDSISQPASDQQQSSAGKVRVSATYADAARKSSETEKRSAEIDPSVLSSVRRLPNGDVRDLIIGALKAGIRHRSTKKGIMFYGDNGKSATIHYSVSDKRAGHNILRDLKGLGYEPGK